MRRRRAAPRREAGTSATHSAIRPRSGSRPPRRTPPPRRGIITGPPKLSACRCSPLVRENLAYGILLQPGGHLEPTDATLIGAAMRELVEETGVDPAGIVPASQVPAYVEYGQVPARPDRGEPTHFHLDFGFSFATASADVGLIQESEVRGAAWYPLAEAERLVGRRIARAVSAPA